MDKEKTLNLVGEFTWLWGQEFFIETSERNFIWRDPDYGGDNSIRVYSGSFQDYLKEIGLDYGRSKGKHFIAGYCGENVLFMVVDGEQ